ncbi:hypothetical protein ILYODFUR_028714 [Ilyodon furcidens]|uniref:Uncharacterized protein n=1 Tax=Ilyodon furcidens TaxID=33524 RepID=A0ABV0TPE1_9TELE
MRRVRDGQRQQLTDGDGSLETELRRKEADSTHSYRPGRRPLQLDATAEDVMKLPLNAAVDIVRRQITSSDRRGAD